MLTDDDLTRQLGSAFREEAGDLEYAGRVPTPRRTTPWLAAATVAAVAAVVAAPMLIGGDGAADRAPRADPPTHSATHQPTLVKKTLTLAGYTLTYRNAAGDPDPISWTQATSVPDDATPVDTAGPAQAWVGTDPASGDAALWMKTPTRNDGNLFVILSPTWTQDQLVDLLDRGSVGYKSAS